MAPSKSGLALGSPNAQRRPCKPRLETRRQEVRKGNASRGPAQLGLAGEAGTAPLLRDARPLAVRTLRFSAWGTAAKLLLLPREAPSTPACRAHLPKGAEFGFRGGGCV